MNAFGWEVVGSVAAVAAVVVAVVIWLFPSPRRHDSGIQATIVGFRRSRTIALSRQIGVHQVYQSIRVRAQVRLYSERFLDDASHLKSVQSSKSN